MQRLCEDQVAAQIATLAGKPTLNTQLTPGQAPAVGTDPYLAVARRIGAGAIVRTTFGSSAMVAGPAGPTIGIGGGGGSGGRAAAGPEASAASRSRSAEPLSANAYSTETVLIDPASGGIMWSTGVSTPASQDVTSRIVELAKAPTGAMKQAGFF